MSISLGRSRPSYICGPGLLGLWIVCCLHLKIETRLCAKGMSVSWQISFPLRNSFNKTEPAIFPMQKILPPVFPFSQIVRPCVHNSIKSPKKYLIL